MSSVEILAPSAGSVIDVFVTVGQQVAAHEELLVIESMKMEIPVAAEVAGTVEEVLVQATDPVNNGDVVVRINRGS